MLSTHESCLSKDFVFVQKYPWRRRLGPLCNSIQIVLMKYQYCNVCHCLFVFLRTDRTSAASHRYIRLQWLRNANEVPRVCLVSSRQQLRAITWHSLLSSCHPLIILVTFLTCRILNIQILLTVPPPLPSSPPIFTSSFSDITMFLPPAPLCRTNTNQTGQFYQINWTLCCCVCPSLKVEDKRESSSSQICLFGPDQTMTVGRWRHRSSENKHETHWHGQLKDSPARAAQW